jgi:predicted permease
MAPEYPIGGLVGALLPVFFVLALGYIAGKRNSFDPDQAAGLSKLALSFALPASLFVKYFTHSAPHSGYSLRQTLGAPPVTCLRLITLPWAI